MAEQKPDGAALAAILDHQFTRPELLREALTHPVRTAAAAAICATMSGSNSLATGCWV